MQEMQDRLPAYEQSGSDKMLSLFPRRKAGVVLMWKLGIDLDKPSYLRVLITYFNGRYFYGEPEVYRTRNGYHFVFNVSTSVEARLGLGDDKRRLELSELRQRVDGELDDITFDTKWDGKRWRRREKIDSKSLLADPFWYMPRIKIRRWRNGKSNLRAR